jgi:ankyrin repeat protein
VICALLIEHGARIDARNRQGHTPLEVAVLAGKISVARLLLQRGAALDARHLLGEAIRAGTDFRDVYDFLIRHGADLNAPDAAGDTPLIIAVRTGNRLTVKRLVDRGADINHPGADGLTPLGLARRRGDGDIVRLLQQYGAAGGS